MLFFVQKRPVCGHIMQSCDHKRTIKCQILFPENTILCPENANLCAQNPNLCAQKMQIKCNEKLIWSKRNVTLLTNMHFFKYQAVTTKYLSANKMIICVKNAKFCAQNTSLYGLCRLNINLCKQKNNKVLIHGHKMLIKYLFCSIKNDDRGHRMLICTHKILVCSPQNGK